MEFLFLILQIALAIGGSLLVLFTRHMQFAFAGFLCVLMALNGFLLQTMYPFSFYAFHILSLIILSALIYFIQAKTFRTKHQRPLDTHLGLSRLLALLTSFYFFGTLVPFWPLSHTNGVLPNQLLAQKELVETSTLIWICSFILITVICCVGIIPLFKESTTES